MILTDEDTNLLNNLKTKVKSVLTYVSQKEKILSKQEGTITIVIPSPLDEQGEYCVNLTSYLMDSSSLPREWSGTSLKIALQKAISGIQYWGQFERDAVPYGLHDYE